MNPFSILVITLAMMSATVQARDYNIMDYGARLDTTVLSTEALQRAIDDCSRAGGGRVVVPTGSYKITAKAAMSMPPS